MQFNSLQFALFFGVVFFLYLALKHRWQNGMLLAASCVFYAAWDWRFLTLIFISITTDYFCGLKIQKSRDEKIQKRFLLLSIFVNLAILGFFKYFNFFTVNFARLINWFGFSAHPHILNIILPIGISFYTFKTMSYTIDVYTGKVEPTRNYLDYALFVIFFPLLLAGPIMRAGDLLRQISLPRKPRLEWFYEGCYLIFWGLFQKIFVADNLARVAAAVFDSSPPYNGACVLLALYAFAFQIYCDFAGYSNIAMGIGKCMGFDIMLNFNLPYFAVNPRDFWSRWHISLSNWLRDYLYFPLAMMKRSWGSPGPAFAAMAAFLLCGLWHGAAWTFVVWGGYWGLLLVAHSSLKPLLEKMPHAKTPAIGRFWFCLKIAFFFQLICFGWLIFRAQSFPQIKDMIHGLVFNFNVRPGTGAKTIAMDLIFFLWPLLLIEMAQYIRNDLLIALKINTFARAVIYSICFYLIVVYGVQNGKEFIYFQF